MKRITFESKENLTQFCKNKCLDIRSLYKENVHYIENHNATIGIEYRFFCRGRYDKYPTSDSPCSLIICIFIYPAGYPESFARKAYVCQCYHSKIGVVKRINNSAYQLNINEKNDWGMNLFFKRYVRRLGKLSVDVALKEKFSDVLLNAIIPKRIGSFFNKTYHGFSLNLVIIIILLLLLLILRLLTPTGYHPSLK